MMKKGRRIKRIRRTTKRKYNVCAALWGDIVIRKLQKTPGAVFAVTFMVEVGKKDCWRMIYILLLQNRFAAIDYV
jgi:hypothetical protein